MAKKMRSRKDNNSGEQAASTEQAPVMQSSSNICFRSGSMDKMKITMIAISNFCEALMISEDNEDNQTFSLETI